MSPKKHKAGSPDGNHKSAARKSTFKRHIAKLMEIHQQADAVFGACIVKDPKSGAATCIRTTPDACKAVKGKFVGGECG